jgi:ribosomal protein L11 methyltransferase
MGNVLSDIDMQSEIKSKTYNTILVNIVADVIINLTSFIREWLSDDGICIASGIIKERLNDVCESIINGGFNIVKILDRDDWGCVVFK